MRSARCAETRLTPPGPTSKVEFAFCAEAMLPKPFSVFPGADFVQRPRIRKNHQRIQLIRRREVL